MKELAKQYDPSQVEDRIYQFWQDGGYFHTEADPDKKPYTIVMPPPNVTGQLHMGHALDNTMQDVLIRTKRMQGYAALWVPGTDHASIATEAKVVEAMRAEGLTKEMVGRDGFLERAWAWKTKYGNRIVSQLKKLGSSCDWDRERFTMDEGCSEAVKEVFVRLYDKGLIYRGNRMVNWCPHCNTSISDAEVEYEEKDGNFWHLLYPVKETGEMLELATTRPETMLGDTAVAINGDDPRYAHLHGCHVVLPLLNKEIPIVCDEHADMTKGTGVVKITPAHDPNDFEVGLRHDLPIVRVFTYDGRMTGAADKAAADALFAAGKNTVNEPHVLDCGKYAGMTTLEARKAILADLKEGGFLKEIEPLKHEVGTCYRCHSTIEPMVSKQWFVKMEPLAKPAIESVEKGDIKFVPERFTKNYMNWMKNTRDWCISRQLWWGHRIPVFYCEDCGWEDALTEDTDVCPKCGGHHVHQDENVLDTWFSSQLWTFATQGWPQKPELLEGHHPTTALVTARDIIALWVARMVMSSLYFLDEVPFKDVVIYPTILAKDGSRMSKSKGNGVDPMDLIGMYGADAMRYNLLTLCTNNQDVKFDANIDKKTKKLIDSPRTDQAKSFVTKIWNASRFLLMNMEGYTPGEPVVETPADAWMFSRLAKAVKMVTEGIENYTFGDMARGVQQFFWNEVCDWYVEVTKARLKGEGRLQAQRNLIFVLDTSIRLMHPLMPFVTEEIWDNMPASVLDLDAEGNVNRAEALMIAKWPEPADYAKYVDEGAERAFELCRAVVSAARATRSRYRLSPKAELDVVVRAGAEDVEKLESLRSTIEPLANTASLVMGTDVEKPAASIAVVDSGVEVFVVLEGKVDLSAEKARLEKEIAAAQKELAGCEKTLANEGFVAKAAPAVVQKKRDRAAELKEILAALTAQVADFS